MRTVAIEAARNDLGDNYRNGCHLSLTETALPPCTFGDTGSPRTVVLFGDSHAAQWFDPLRDAASATGWKLIAWTKTSCPAADLSIWYAPGKVPYAECPIWRADVLIALAKIQPQAVIIADASTYSGWIMDPRTEQLLDDSAAAIAYKAGLARTVAQVAATGAKVTIIRDNPRMSLHFLDCVAWQDDCGSPKSQAISGWDDDPENFPPGASVVDFTNLICSPTTCPAMKDGKIIYHDNEHLTASYAKTFTPQFETILKGIGARLPS